MSNTIMLFLLATLYPEIDFRDTPKVNPRQRYGRETLHRINLTDNPESFHRRIQGGGGEGALPPPPPPPC